MPWTPNAYARRAKYQTLLHSLVPREVVKRLWDAAGTGRGLGQDVRYVGTPADKLSHMLNQLLAGGMPDLKDVIMVRSEMVKFWSTSSGA